MMSILLLTLLSWLHCQSEPVAELIGRMSLLPVANVVSSDVQKIDPVSVSEQVPLRPVFVLKSRLNDACVNPVVLLGLTRFVVDPFALKRLSQSRFCLVQFGTVPHAVLVSPSNWNF